MGYYIAHNITGHFLEFPSREELLKSTRYMSMAYLFIYYYENEYGGPGMDPECRGYVSHLDNKEMLIQWLNITCRHLRQGKFKYPQNVTNKYLKRVDEI